MEGFGGQGETHSTTASMTARVLNVAQRTWGHEVDAPVLAQCASEAMADLWRNPIKARTFVPVLAHRRIRDMLDQRGRTPIGGDHTR